MKHQPEKGLSWLKLKLEGGKDTPQLISLLSQHLSLFSKLNHTEYGVELQPIKIDHCFSIY